MHQGLLAWVAATSESEKEVETERTGFSQVSDGESPSAMSFRGASRDSDRKLDLQQCSAVIYTFVEQIRRHGADPFAYFEWVFGKFMHNPLVEELELLLPIHWIEARAAKAEPIEVETTAVA